MLSENRIPKNHPLHYFKKLDVKNNHRHHLHQEHLKTAIEHISIMVNKSEAMICLMDRLDIHPHGDDSTEEKRIHQNILVNAGIKCTTVGLHQKYFNNNYVTVIREGYYYDEFDFAKYSKLVAEPLMRLIQNKRNQFRNKDARIDGGISFRVQLGISRYQSGSDTVQWRSKQFNLPPLNKSGELFLKDMDPDLKARFGELLRDCQDILKSQKPDAFGDSHRNEFWRSKWSGLHWPKLGLCWEFVTIGIQSSSHVLGCHLDYMNDTRIGYTHCLVYSTVLSTNGDGLFSRVTVIMTYRVSCGRVMDKIRKCES